MKIAILGATGKAGSSILKEAKKRGEDVTAIVRNKKNLTDDTPAIEKDVYQLTTEDLKDFDVLVNALGFWSDFDEFSKSTQHLIDILKNQKTQMFVVGGAGSLYVNPEHTMQLKDTPEFPEDFRPLATGMSKALDLLKKSSDVHWTYISPAIEFDAQGAETGKYVITGEEVTTADNGKSYISYADYAVAMLDLIQENNHLNERISVRN